MKKITLLLFMMLFYIGSQAQIICTQNFTVSGTDSGPTVLTINAADITCNGADAATSLQLINAADSLITAFCTTDGTSWYGFDLSVDGGAAVPACAMELNNLNIFGFTTLTITSHDDDDFTDNTTITIDVEVTYTPSSAPNCDAMLTNPADGDTFAATDGDITWSTATGGAAGYNLTVGTTNGGSEVLAMTDVGNVNTYALGALAEATEYFVSIMPYNTLGDATGCTENSFITLSTAPPANDAFANAEAVACDGNYTGNTTYAILDEDTAPDGFGADLDAPNVWYTYTGSGAEEEITLDLCPSTYDSSILVYTGTSGALTLVAANDDAGTAICTEANRSFLTFVSDGLTTYYITVEGFNVTSIGGYDMTVSCTSAAPVPANDLCANPEALTLAISSSGTTAGATGEAADANPTCENNFATIVDVWYSVAITGGTSNLTINTTITGTSDQANVAVYDDCALTTSLGCSDANNGESLTIAGLANGTYMVRVWSDGISARRIEGTFDIVADATLSTTDFDNDLAFSYYPNPVSSALKLTAQKDIENVSIYNMLGQEVLRTAPNTVNTEVNMSNLQSGAYFVKVTIGNATETVRVIKN